MDPSPPNPARWQLLGGCSADPHCRAGHGAVPDPQAQGLFSHLLCQMLTRVAAVTLMGTPECLEKTLRILVLLSTTGAGSKT